MEVKKFSLVRILISKNNNVIETLLKCNELIFNVQLKSIITELSKAFTLINSDLLDGDFKTDHKSILILEQDINKKRWLRKDSIFLFDNEYTILEEVTRGISIALNFYKKQEFSSMIPVSLRNVELGLNQLKNHIISTQPKNKNAKNSFKFLKFDDEK